MLGGLVSPGRLLRSCQPVSTLLPLMPATGETWLPLVKLLTTKSSPNGLPYGSKRRACTENELGSGAGPEKSCQVTTNPPSWVAATLAKDALVAAAVLTAISGLSAPVSEL